LIGSDLESAFSLDKNNRWAKIIVGPVLEHFE